MGRSLREKLIVVGKNSYIGRCFVEFAVSQGERVIALSSKDCNFLIVPEVLDFFRHLDDAPHTVVFFAVVNKSVDNSFQAFLDNVQIVKHLIDGCRHASIASIVYFSSVDVYGAHPALPITEQSRVNPDTWYGLAKYTCEWMLTASGDMTCPVTVLRIPGVFGYAPNDRSVIGRMIASIRREKRIFVNGEGRALRDYIYVLDLCRLLEILIPLKCCKVLNVASGESRSILEIASLVGCVLGMDFEIVHRPSDPARDFDLVFDNRSLISLVPDFRFSSLKEGVRTYLAVSESSHR